MLLLASAGVTLAHDGGPRLVVEPARVSPGGVVGVRGEDLGADHEMRIALVGDGTQADLATVVSDGQGHFTVAVQISADAPPGRYRIQAAGEDGASLTAAMSIEGPPVVDGDGAPPGQDEGLPALEPSAAAQAAPGQIATAGSIPPATGETAPTPGATAPASEIDPVPFVALAGAVGGLGLLFWRTRRSRVTAESADLS